MTDFHKSKEWKNLAKDFKTLKCVDCGKTEDIEAGHILPASRFKMSRLWKSNLVAQCRSCNAKLGNKIHWGYKAIKLLSIYAMIKLLKYSASLIIISIVIRFVYLDITRNGSTIINQMEYDLLTFIDSLNLS